MSERRPEVSIAIPAYGRPLQLAQAIESVLAQSFDDLELVISDDGGDAEELARSYGDPRVRYLANPTRLGMAANWEAALERSRGRYVGLLMDDDRLLPGYVETLHGVLERHADVGIAFANHLFDRDGELEPRPELIAPGLHRDILLTLVRFNPVPICSTLFRRDVVARLLPLPDTHTADFIMMMRAALARVAFFYVAEPLMIYRVHGEQLSGRPEFRQQVLDMWERFDFPAESEVARVHRETPMWH